MPVLTGIDVLGIQRYVFASNRLRDVLAASWMVDHITKREADSLLQWGMADDRVLLAAGGNAILEFDKLEDAKKWATRYTRWLLDEAPGLEVVVAHRPYENGRLAWGLKALATDLARAKLERRPSVPQLGLGVTAGCSVTGLPATVLDRHDRTPISPQIEMLRQGDIQGRAKERWDEYLPETLSQARGWRARFPLELDDMGRSHGEASLVGVVHVDGDGVGQAIKDWLDRCLDEEVDDEQVRTQFRAWSSRIDEVGMRVLSAISRRVASCIVEEESERSCVVRGTPRELGFSLKTDENTVSLPFRPILLGGDDLTFVCDGRLALDLAAAALREFELHPIPHLGEDGKNRTLTACAGIALVKAHAPFHRSYALAESLCASAKRARLASNEKAQAETGCWLDWHVGSTRPGESIEDVRRREYERNKLKLTMRPYPVARFNGRRESWEWLDAEVLGPGNTLQAAHQGFRGAACWAGSRSRVKRLGSLVLAGGDGVARQTKAWNAVEGGVELPGGVGDDGFIGKETPLLDALELLDLHVRLESEPSAANLTDTTAAKEETTR